MHQQQNQESLEGAVDDGGAAASGEQPSAAGAVAWDRVSEVIDTRAQQREAAWIAYRRERHQLPEPSGEERETSHSICERLRQLGIAARITDRGVGVVGDILLGGATESTPAVALRADIDALRMPDRKTVAHASARPGLAHACGHDVHTTVVLGAAELLAQFQTGEHDDETLDICPPCEVSTPPARIRLIFQAAEETGEGAEWMVEDGYLSGVASILGVHVDPNLLAGHMGIRYGVLTAAVDALEITVRGKGGHTARPHTTTDPVLAASLLVSNLYQSLPRVVDVREASVFSVGQIHGGFAPNVIPDEVQVIGTLRTIDPTGRQRLMEQIEATTRCLAELTGNEITIKSLQSLGCVVNSQRETEVAEQASREVIGDDRVHIIDRPSMGGEDFAVYVSECAGAQLRLGCAKEMPWPHLHSTLFDVDERAIAVGARVMARAALQLAW